MTTPVFNWKQTLLRSFKPLLNALRVCIVNTDPIDVNITPSVQSPVITHLSAPDAGDEVSHVIPDGTRKLFFQVQGTAVAKFTFVATESGTKGITLRKRNAFSDNILNTSSLVLYIQTDKDAQIIEILTWT